MSHRKLDDNEVARFLDGTLPKGERDRALAHLADSDVDLEVLGDAAYLLGDLGEEDVPAGGGAEVHNPRGGDADRDTGATVTPLPPPSTRRGWRRAPARWLALAAVLAGVVLVPLALSRSGAREPGDFATLLASRDAGLPRADWIDRPRWSVTRGAGDAVVDNARAARLGALQVDLEVAAAAGQADETRRLSAMIAEGLNDLPGSGAVAAAYRDIGARAEQPAAALAPSLAQARESLVLFMDEDHFSLGAWTEAASIAVQRRDAAFFHARASQKMLERAASLPSLDEQSRATVDAIRTAAAADPPNWAALKKQTNALLHQIAS